MKYARTTSILYTLCAIIWLINGIISPEVIDFALAVLFASLSAYHFRSYRKFKRNNNVG